jgi:hypothetical protein
VTVMIESRLDRERLLTRKSSGLARNLPVIIMRISILSDLAQMLEMKEGIDCSFMIAASKFVSFMTTGQTNLRRMCARSP